jgi:hypothetical protein
MSIVTGTIPSPWARLRVIYDYGTTPYVALHRGIIPVRVLLYTGIIR